MNANSIAKHYALLTVEERFRLILAASARGDESERDRVGKSSPRLKVTMPDYYGLADGLRLLGHLHVTQLLELAATFWEFKSKFDAAFATRGDSEEDVARLERMMNNLEWGGYLFVSEFDAWPRFCADENLHGERLLSLTPGYRTVLRTEPVARAIAFTREEAAAWVHANDGKTEQMATVENVAAEMWEIVRECAATWGIQIKPFAERTRGAR